MTTKTDFHSVRELNEKYTPEERGIVSKAEIDLIRSVLELDSRNDIELQNIRDLVVILYGEWSESLRRKYDETKDGAYFDRAMQYSDASSAIVCVIDHEKVKRGMEP